MQDHQPGADSPFDVIVVGGGNAGLCAALAAREHVERVVILEKAPYEKRGGNSYFTGGRMRIPHAGLEDLANILGTDLEELADYDVEPYPPERFVDDVQRLAHYQADEQLVRTVAFGAREAVRWMQESLGARFELALGEDDIRVDGKIKLVGGDDLQHYEGGPGLVENLLKRAEERGIEIRYGCAVKRLVRTDRGIEGVIAQIGGTYQQIRGTSVILACGGFEANARMRASYLGPGWDLAKVRGTEFNTGDGLEMAFEVGARAYGHWSGCHSVACDYFAPPFGDRVRGDVAERVSYRAGVTVDKNGERFFDEASDLRAYTYAVSGRLVIERADGFAVQVIDKNGEPYLRRNYSADNVTKAVANDLRTLATELGVDPDGLERTITRYNEAVSPGAADFSRLDGKGTTGLLPPKSNWAVPIVEPPFTGFPVSAGITFTFGGVRVNTEGEVLDEGAVVIPGLYAAGEMVGGIFYNNYPGGSGLVSGLVMGRAAGLAAGLFARKCSREG